MKCKIMKLMQHSYSLKSITKTVLGLKIDIFFLNKTKNEFLIVFMVILTSPSKDVQCVSLHEGGVQMSCLY